MGRGGEGRRGLGEQVHPATRPCVVKLRLVHSYFPKGYVAGGAEVAPHSCPFLSSRGSNNCNSEHSSRSQSGLRAPVRLASVPHDLSRGTRMGVRARCWLKLGGGGKEAKETPCRGGRGPVGRSYERLPFLPVHPPHGPRGWRAVPPGLAKPQDPGC